MAKRITITIIVILILAAAVGAGYYYFMRMQPSAAAPLSGQTTPLSQPDTTVLAGPIIAISAKSITIAKQPNATPTTLTIDAGTAVKAAAAGGGAGTTKKVSDLAKGMMVLITPVSGNTSTAYSIVILPLPPPPPNQ